MLQNYRDVPRNSTLSMQPVNPCLIGTISVHVPCPCAKRASSRIEPPHHDCDVTVSTSTRHNSTTMDPIQEEIEVIELLELGAQFSYHEVAKKFGIDRSTLSRSHQRKTRSNIEESRQ
jgi:predicted DNA-binding protein (UPF0251 family)